MLLTFAPKMAKALIETLDFCYLKLVTSFPLCTLFRLSAVSDHCSAQHNMIESNTAVDMVVLSWLVHFTCTSMVPRLVQVVHQP